jgi:hypothetical protein
MSIRDIVIDLEILCTYWTFIKKFINRDSIIVQEKKGTQVNTGNIQVKS